MRSKKGAKSYSLPSPLASARSSSGLCMSRSPLTETVNRCGLGSFSGPSAAGARSAARGDRSPESSTTSNQTAPAEAITQTIANAAASQRPIGPGYSSSGSGSASASA